MEFKLYHQNIRGIRSKTKDCYNSVLSSDFDLICFTETWLCDGIFSSEFIDQRYLVERRDRNKVLTN